MDITLDGLPDEIALNVVKQIVDLSSIFPLALDLAFFALTALP